MFDVNLYNRLPSISSASATLHSKLASTNLTLDALLSRLRPLFCSDEYKGKYGIWLVHHHFNLEEGERMVKSAAVTQPTRDRSEKIVAERWSARGEELEHAYHDAGKELDDLPPPPPAEFIRQFQEITGAYGIDCLGICYPPSQEEVKTLRGGYMFMETCHEGRKHVLTPISAGDASLNGASVIKTTWSMSDDAGFGECVCSCFVPVHGMEVSQ